MQRQADSYANHPRYGELAAILLAGLAHVLVELGVSERAAGAYSVCVSLAFVAYIVWRIRQTPAVLRVWGFRRDNFRSAALAQLGFVAIGAVALVTATAVSKSVSLPRTFWLSMALYPVWGLAQQFALQNLIVRNLAEMFPGPLGLAVVSAALFAASHYPRLELMVLTFVAGIFFTLIYRRFPNLWAVGIAHGILGSLAIYLVLEEDPGAVILRYLMGWQG